jgi:hypothetical protein
MYPANIRYEFLSFSIDVRNWLGLIFTLLFDKLENESQMINKFLWSLEFDDIFGQRVTVAFVLTQ